MVIRFCIIVILLFQVTIIYTFKYCIILPPLLRYIHRVFKNINNPPAISGHGMSVQINTKYNILDSCSGTRDPLRIFHYFSSTVAVSTLPKSMPVWRVTKPHIRGLMGYGRRKSKVVPHPQAASQLWKAGIQLSLFKPTNIFFAHVSI